MECLKLTVQVLAIITCISVSVQTDTISSVLVHVAESHCVPTQLNVWHVKCQSLVLVNISNVEVFVIDHEVGDSKTSKIDEYFSLFSLILQVEVDHCFSKVVFALVESKLEVVLNFRNELTTTFCLLLLESEVDIVSRVKVGVISKMLDDKILNFIGGHEALFFVSHVFLC